MFLATCLSGGAAAHEADDGYGDAYRRCVADAGGATPAMLECDSAEYERQDARLNAVYRRIIATLSTQRSAKLREAQRAWIRFRDENCAYYDDPEGGQAARINASGCLLRATKERADELERMGDS